MMNYNITKIALLLIAGLGFQSITNAALLKVVIEGIESSEGNLDITLFSSEDQWLKEGVQKHIPVTEKDLMVEIDALEPGLYAVSVTHDVDGNGQLNTGAFGKPEEPYGFSNDARGMFGPAKWKDAVFEVTEGEHEIHIRIR